MDPGYRHYQKDQWYEPLLRLDNPEVADYVSGTFEQWARMGVDGFRIDAASDVPMPLLRRISSAVHCVNADAVLFGEVIPDNQWRWTRDSLHSATDFVLQEALRDWVVRRTLRARDVASIQVRRHFVRGGPGWASIGFVGTHDQTRLETLVRDSRATRLAHLMILMRPEIPALYYGDEVGLRSDEPGAAFEDVWPDRMCMPWTPDVWNAETQRLVREAIGLRTRRVALRRGDCEPLRGLELDEPMHSEDLLAFRRRAGEEVIEVYLHGGEGTVRLPLPTDAPSHAGTLLVLGEASIEERHVFLGPWSGLVLERTAQPEVQAAWRAGLVDNRHRSDMAFAQGQLETLSLPAHLYLTVTERCNLRCRHCITHAPERTRDGHAREMPPWLIEQLRGAFEAATYFGFSHGGESLSSPVFMHLLEAIQEAKKGVSGSYDVHLLTNGMLLDADRLARLVERNVTSIAVSLDGTSARTNDDIRTGSRVASVIEHLRNVVRFRESTGANLRIGISMVACASNLGELVDMGRLVADLGLDWLKIEEMFPCNAFARNEMLFSGDPRLIDAMAELHSIAERAAFVLVDHLAAPQTCDCESTSDALVRRFRRADNFANRAVFKPCRVAWEQACIDPDGTVHVADYDQPGVGNLLQTAFLDLWNNTLAQRVRWATSMQFPGARRVSCPLSD